MTLPLWPQVVTPEQLQELYKRGLRQAESAAANSYHCRTANCEGFCFYEDEVNEFHCPICRKVNCLLCKAIHEGMDCQEYQDDLKRRAANDEAAKATQEMLKVRGGGLLLWPNSPLTPASLLSLLCSNWWRKVMPCTALPARLWCRRRTAVTGCAAACARQRSAGPPRAHGGGQR